MRSHRLPPTIFLAATLLWFLSVLPALSTTASLSAGLSPGDGFVGVSGTNFTLDGKPFHYAGTNCYYLMVYSADPGLRADVDEVLEEAVAMGLRVIRTWAFNDGSGWNALQTAPGLYDETVFEGLDYVLYRASELGLRVILPLINNWVDYGGMDQYVAWSPTATYHDDFYTDDSTRVWYRNHATTVISRVNTFNGRLYRDDPTVFAWELANEPRCPSDKTGNTLLAWIEEMSAHIESLDSNHLVTTGIEGFYNDASGPWYLNGWEGVDYIRDHQVATIDFATAHSWPDNWSLGFTPIMDLLSRQIADAAGTIGKPFILEEFGKHRDGVLVSGARNHYDPATYFSPGVEPYDVKGASGVTVDRTNAARTYFEGTVARLAGDTTTRDLFFAAYYDSLYTHQAGGSNFWILYHDAYPDYDGYGVYYPADNSTVALIEDQADRMENHTLSAYADFRYKDIATNVYAASYRERYLYRDADVSISFEPTSTGNFSGHLSASGLKPNFAYQVKLLGKPEVLWGADGDDVTNERIGYAGRWWELQPNPGNRDDAYYEAHKNDTGYIFEGYLLFDFFLTDANGSAELDFVTDGSYHVLWWVGQRAPGSCDSPPKWATVVADASSPAYDQNAGPTDVGVYAEIERLCDGETQLPPGSYSCRAVLSEESFHQSGPHEGWWAFAMACDDFEFEVVLDTIPPSPPTNFVALPGHGKVHLTWTDPVGDFVGVEIRRVGWTDYPEYGTGTPVVSEPSYPADETQGDPVALVLGGVGLYEDDPLTQDVYYYAAFSHDAVGNYSAGATDRSTSYWLGDMSPASEGDGLIDIDDLSLFSVTFGEIPGGGGWNAEGDFGPTDDFSRFGIPEPDDRIDFEDLMIMAMNYGKVTPAGTSGQMILASSETPLRELVSFRLVPISRDENRVTYAVMIENDAELLKGFSLDLSYGFGNELVEVRSSTSLTGKGSEHFFGTIEREAGKVELCVASLGVNRSFNFTGEVARIVVREGSGVPALVQLEKADVRDVNNRRDEVTVTNDGRETPAVPTVSALLQNHPNPFNPTTTITFDVSASGQVRVDIYDVSGRLVRSLVNDRKDAGRYTVDWNGRDANGSQVHTGVYFYRMTAPGYTSPAKKMVLLK